ncbi:L-histidine N(alpha)-methyltransferase [Blastomonas aquatica]|uniref:Dimethylhistidine N-methyltransferase n=1 Tax=Blastomonas aquatica TaxID=1510276 RepID=A0ABQ1JBP8_9SPHN|nr:L-histidine N(alpha)-methyltransferase [Blastomonas aquatica]GGB62519.1 dimethylhistidine N-methyltransferase [Blastomonas aquatica]
MSTRPQAIDAIPDVSVASADPAFRADILACFRSTRRAIPARWLYDLAGSELFEAITDLPEYYPTRTETALLERYCGEVAAHGGAGRAVVEFGSGSSVKTPHLLRAVQGEHYVPIDISGDFLRDSASALAADFPELAVHPLEGDFMHPLKLPEAVAGVPKLGFFPGSTIGNMVARTSLDLLRSMRETLGEGAMLLIGMDRIKSPDILIPAYDDAQGVTAEFNLNLLRRINRELDGDIPVDRFCHVARWNDSYARIEMHLEAQADIDFHILGEGFSMARGETIHTENSHKYGPRDARLLLRSGGWTTCHEWTDPDDWFALILAEAKPFQSAP